MFDFTISLQTMVPILDFCLSLAFPRSRILSQRALIDFRLFIHVAKWHLTLHFNSNFLVHYLDCILNLPVFFLAHIF